MPQATLHELLPPGTVGEWFEAALQVLAEVGLAVPDEVLAGRLAACEGVHVHAGRACFQADTIRALVDAACTRAERPPVQASGSRIVLHAGSHAHHTLDPRTDELRPMSTADLIVGTKLVDALHDQDVVGSAPGVPQDVPPPVMSLVQMRVGCLYSRHGGTFANTGSARHARWLRRMAEAAGQPFSMGVHLPSPLQLSGNELDVALQLLGEGVTHSVGSMPMMGATAPQSFAGAAIQGIAEVVGGFAALRLLGAERVGFGVNVYAFDHRHASIVYGSPEQNLADAVQVAVNRYFGAAAPFTRSMRSMSKSVDVQACAERAASAVFGALLGSRHFGGAGLLSLDEVFSPLQLVLDREIADYAGRLADGVALDDAARCVATIAEGAREGSYLGHPLTVERFRAECWSPRFFEHQLLEPWRHAGAVPALEKARDAALDLMRAETYRCPEAKADAIEEVFRAAWADLCGQA